jgi:hypothetical protein
MKQALRGIQSESYPRTSASCDSHAPHPWHARCRVLGESGASPGVRSRRLSGARRCPEARAEVSRARGAAPRGGEGAATHHTSLR